MEIPDQIVVRSLLCFLSVNLVFVFVPLGVLPQEVADIEISGPVVRVPLTKFKNSKCLHRSLGGYPPHFTSTALFFIFSAVLFCVHHLYVTVRHLIVSIVTASG